MLYSPVRRIGPRWGATRAPTQAAIRRGRGFSLLPFFLAPPVAPKAINPGGVGAKPPPYAPAGASTKFGKSSKTQSFFSVL